MADAHSLHCPNCGSPAAPGDQTCQYCHAALATVSCPSCFALMFEGAAYCPPCGARRSRTADGSRRARCSGCFGVMLEVQVGPTVLMECEKCHAMWVDSATFERICADRDTQGVVLELYASPEPTPTPASVAEVRYRRCVACGTMMNRLNFGRISGTVIDVCKGHGAFLDAGELHRIVTFIRHGGLDRARQRQIEDLKELQTAQSRLEPMPSGGFDMSSTAWTGVDLLKLLENLKI
jgi:hypothetical protein